MNFNECGLIKTIVNSGGICLPMAYAVIGIHIKKDNQWEPPNSRIITDQILIITSEMKELIFWKNVNEVYC